jgi:hypothetical protein
MNSYDRRGLSLKENGRKKAGSATLYRRAISVLVSSDRPFGGNDFHATV